MKAKERCPDCKEVVLHIHQRECFKRDPENQEPPVLICKRPTTRVEKCERHRGWWGWLRR